MTAQMITGVALTGLVGASLGLFGAGGSIILLPVLVYVMGIEPHAAVPLSLAIVGITSVLGVVVSAGRREIDWPTALRFGSAAIGASYLGGRLTDLLPESVLLLSFGVLLVVVGFRMWVAPNAGTFVSDGRRRPSLMLAAGSLVGVLTGFLGVGGGFLIVPALVKIGGLGMARAASTSLVVIAASSIAGLAGHLANGTRLSWGVAGPLLIAALLGMTIGVRAARQIRVEHLRRGFAGLVASVGLALIAGNAPAASMMNLLQQPWPWYVAGPLIGLMVPLLLLIGGKSFGISSNFRHLCAAALPNSIPLFTYDWRHEGGWNLSFALGILIGGLAAARLLLPDGYSVAISIATQRDLHALGLHDLSGLVPQELMGWHALTSRHGWLTLVVGGFLVGFGSRWAGGCTSGHAIAGLATFQLPSLIAVLGFFAGGLLVTHIMMPVLF